MLLLLILLFPVVEIYLLVQVGSRFGAINTIFALLAAAVLGAGIARAQGRHILAKIQNSLAQGQMPTSQVLHGLLVFVGGVLFLVPGFATDAVAVFFVAPGPRHVLVAYLQRKLEKQINQGQFRVFSYGNFGGNFGGGFKAGHSSSTTDHPVEWERDVTPKVIDVQPISSETIDKPEGRNR